VALRLVYVVECKMHTNLSSSWALGCPKFVGRHVRELNPGLSTIDTARHVDEVEWEVGTGKVS
jgi:hypothetical protein